MEISTSIPSLCMAVMAASYWHQGLIRGNSQSDARGSVKRRWISPGLSSAPEGLGGAVAGVGKAGETFSYRLKASESQRHGFKINGIDRF